MQTPARYEIIDSIASGDFATVYRGHDHELNRDVAIKQIHHQYLEDPAQLDRYWQEAQLLASLQHPHILTIYDVVRERGWLILELASGSLPQLLAGRGIDLKDLRLTLTYTLHGLKAMHEAGIVHGDIKPGNLLVDRNQRVKLGDFGIARRLSGDDGSVVKGTTKYIAPEVVSDQFGPVGPHSDLYSLGFTAYELMCGEHFETLFPGLNMYGRDQQIAWMMWHSAADRRVPEVSRVLEGVPGDLAHVVQRLVEKDPAKRYRTADEVLADLNADAEAPPSVADPAAEEAAATQAKAAKRKRTLAIAAASCSIVLSLAMLFLPNSGETKGNSEKKQPTTTAQQPGEGTIVEIDAERGRFFVDTSDGGPAQGVTVDTETDRLFVNDARASFENLQKDDRVRIDYLAGSSGAFKEIYVTRELATQATGVLSAVDSTKNSLELTLDDAAKLAVSVNDITKYTLNGEPSRLSLLQPQDRVTLDHRASADGGRMALRVTALRTLSLSGAFVSAADGEVTIRVGDAADSDSEEQTLPLAETCQFSLNGQTTDETGRPLSTYDLMASDRVRVSYDDSVRRIEASRDVTETGVVAEIDYDQRTFMTSAEGEAAPKNYIVAAGCEIQTGATAVDLYFLRVGDRVTVERKSPDPAQREVARVAITPQPDPSAWAIVISYEDYDNPTLPTVPFGKADTAHLIETLQLHYRIPADQILSEQNATRLRLESRISQFLPSVAADSQLIVYFLGHGHIAANGVGYLVPQGFDTKRAESTGLPLRWLVQQVENCPAKEKLILLDTTHAVPQVPASYPSAVQLAESVKENPRRPVSTSAFVVAVCDKGQTAGKGEGRGLLATAFFEALAGGADLNLNHRVDTNELFSFVSRRVATAASAVGHTQTPKLFIPDATPPRISNDAKNAILRVLSYLHRKTDDQLLLDYNNARQLSPNEPDAALAMGLVLMKANRLSSAEEVFGEVRLRHPRAPIAYHALAWKAVWEGNFKPGAKYLEQLATSLPDKGDTDEQKYTTRALAFAGQLSAFGELVRGELKVEHVQGLRDAVAKRGESAKTAYRTGYFAVRDRFDMIKRLIKAEVDPQKRAKLERDRDRLGYYLQMDFDSPEAYLRTGLDR